jgi:hypothetical protein
MQDDLSELMRVGRLEGAERRRLGLLNNSGEQGTSIKVELSQGTELNSTLVTGLRTVSATGTITKKTVTAEVDMDDDKVMFEMEKGPRMRPSQKPAPKPKYGSRWMRRQQTTTMSTQTTATDPEKLAIKITELGSHSKEKGNRSTSGNIEWISSAGEAQEAITRVFQEQAPGIGYCHKCG